MKQKMNYDYYFYSKSRLHSMSLNLVVHNMTLNLIVTIKIVSKDFLIALLVIIVCGKVVSVMRFCRGQMSGSLFVMILSHARSAGSFV